MYSRRIRTTRAARRLMALWAMLAMALVSRLANIDYYLPCA